VAVCMSSVGCSCFDVVTLLQPAHTAQLHNHPSAAKSSRRCYPSAGARGPSSMLESSLRALPWLATSTSIRYTIQQTNNAPGLAPGLHYSMHIPMPIELPCLPAEVCLPMLMPAYSHAHVNSSHACCIQPSVPLHKYTFGCPCCRCSRQLTQQPVLALPQVQVLQQQTGSCCRQRPTQTAARRLQLSC
jgi:hypothetical protein